MNWPCDRHQTIPILLLTAAGIPEDNLAIFPKRRCPLRPMIFSPAPRAKLPSLRVILPFLEVLNVVESA
jgi:hypothetical protein